MSDEAKVIDTGGPAFPFQGQWEYYGREGMNLRDWFAGQAMAGDIEGWSKDSMTDLAAKCYRAADAMIAARKL